MRLSKKAGDFWVSHLTDKVVTLANGLVSEEKRTLALCRMLGRKHLDTSTQGEYTKSKAACENLKDFNVSKR
jgi:hypothetical protein